MKQELIERIPRLPHWRYVLWSGESHPEYDEKMRALARYIEEEKISVGLNKLDEPDEYVEKAIWLYNQPPMKKVAENMLMEGCDSRIVGDVLYHKFKTVIDTNAIAAYRKYFFDTEILNTYDIARYYESTGQRMPESPPVPGSMREAYVAFKNGGEFKIDQSDVLTQMFARSFFRAEELAKMGWPADGKVLKFQKNAVDILRAIREGNNTTELPEEFQFEVEYPDATAFSADKIEGYDPHDDPNSKEEEDERSAEDSEQE